MGTAMQAALSQCKRVVEYPWPSLAIWPRQLSVCETHPPEFYELSTSFPKHTEG